MRVILKKTTYDPIVTQAYGFINRLYYFEDRKFYCEIADRKPMKIEWQDMVGELQLCWGKADRITAAGQTMRGGVWENLWERYEWEDKCGVEQIRFTEHYPKDKMIIDEIAEMNKFNSDLETALTNLESFTVEITENSND